MTTDQNTDQTTIENAENAGIPAGTRVRVTAVGDHHSADYRTWVLGRVGTYVKYDPENEPRAPHVIDFSDSPGHEGNPRRVATGVAIVEPVGGFTAGDRVRVVAVAPGATQEFKEYAVGTEATYMRTEHDNGHRVMFDHPMPDNRDQRRDWWVLRVEAAKAADPHKTVNSEAQAEQVRALHHKRVRVAQTRRSDEPGTGRHDAKAGVVTEIDTGDDRLAFRVRLDDPDHRAPGMDTWWVYAVTPLEPFTASAPAGDQTDQATDGADEARAKDEYTRLANAAVRVAAGQQWCSEFEEVMVSGGFEEVSCTRQRSWTLALEFEYDFMTHQMVSAIEHVFGGASPEVNDYRTTVAVRADVAWSGHDPDDLDTDALATMLRAAGFTGFDESSVNLADREDSADGDRIIDVTPMLGLADTWTQRLAAFTTLIQQQAKDRGWGHHLADVYTQAGLDMPRPEKITVEVTAKRNVYRYDNRYGSLMSSDPAAPDNLTLNKTLRFDIDNPYTGNACHCGERVESAATGQQALLPDVLRIPVIEGALATLRDLMGDDEPAWHALHTDATLSCIYCGS